MNKEQQKSSSLLRNFLRCAVSSIVYHRLFEPTDLGEMDAPWFVKRPFAGISNVIQMLPMNEDGKVLHDDGMYIWLSSCVLSFV